MASWYYNAVQTSFQPAPEGGYVYRCPIPGCSAIGAAIW